MKTKPAVLAEGLHKSYGKTRALRGLDLTVQAGTVLGVLGPNGAGKTTTELDSPTVTPLVALAVGLLLLVTIPDRRPTYRPQPLC